MLRFVFLGLIAVLAGLGVLAPSAEAGSNPPFDKIVVFGDSLSDVGNYYRATSAANDPYPGAPYYQGRFCDGPLWVEYIASNYGLTLTPSSAGGTDYAVVGAEITANQTQTVNGVTIPVPSVKSQVKAYLASVSGAADPNALYVIWGGANDVFDTTAPAALPAAVAQKMTRIVSLLVSAGAKNLLLLATPDIGATPKLATEGASAAAAATALSASLNAAVATALGSTKLPAGVTIFAIDPFNLEDDIIRSSDHFGLLNVTAACISGVGGKVCANESKTLFWDTVHLTTEVHARIAVQVEAILPRP